MDKQEKIHKKKIIILEALKRLLQNDVYSRITVQAVADEAGFSKGGLLHYFPTKEEMYIEFMEYLFNEINNDHKNVLKGNLHSKAKASISAMYGVERFFLDPATAKILINLMLYAYEDEKIMVRLKEFIRRHLELYKTIINEAREDQPQRRKTDFDAEFHARIAQTIVMSAGLFESIDPLPIDNLNFMRYIISLFRG
ncbi:MAG TPA: helix-turn-helix domain-containing protein [Spirochaetota bacterium]|jgi:AcrR family transcriptional regulator|nr:helix-turn-helix domain-containing protein [Spirochaetota bacterium]